MTTVVGRGLHLGVSVQCTAALCSRCTRHLSGSEACAAARGQSCAPVVLVGRAPARRGAGRACRTALRIKPGTGRDKPQSSERASEHFFAVRVQVTVLTTRTQQAASQTVSDIFQP